jgi:hypothetical protein
MASSQKTQPHTGPQAAQAQAERTVREAAALRENLRRRKAQARQRADDKPEAGNAKPDDLG